MRFSLKLQTLNETFNIPDTFIYAFRCYEGLSGLDPSLDKPKNELASIVPEFKSPKSEFDNLRLNHDLGSNSQSFAVSPPYYFRVLISKADETLSLFKSNLVPATATLCLKTEDSQARYFRGIVLRTFRRTSNANGAAQLEVCVYPNLWATSISQKSRVWTNVCAADVLADLREEYLSEMPQFSSIYDLRLAASAQEREIVIQWNESDFEFVSRLLERDGEYYSFVHQENETKLVLLSHKYPALQGLMPKIKLPFIPHRENENRLFFNAVSSCLFEQKLIPKRYAVSDYNPNIASVPLNFASPNSENSAFEIYDYPADISSLSHISDVSSRRLQALQARESIYTVMSKCPHVAPGNLVSVQTEFDETDFMNLRPTQIVHELVRDNENVPVYQNWFEAIDASKHYAPSMRTPTPSIQGTHNAIVVTQNGLLADVDNKARALVVFRWDREGKPVRVRLGQPWAGGSHGMNVLPRGGDEVIVSFIQGNTERPIIITSVHNSKTGKKYEPTKPISLGLEGDTYNGQLNPGPKVPQQLTTAIHNSTGNTMLFSEAKGSELVKHDAFKDFILEIGHKIKQGMSVVKPLNLDIFKEPAALNNIPDKFFISAPEFGKSTLKSMGKKKDELRYKFVTFNGTEMKDGKSIPTNDVDADVASNELTAGIPKNSVEIQTIDLLVNSLTTQYEIGLSDGKKAEYHLTNAGKQKVRTQAGVETNVDVPASFILKITKDSVPDDDIAVWEGMVAGCKVFARFKNSGDNGTVVHRSATTRVLRKSRTDVEVLIALENSGNPIVDPFDATAYTDTDGEIIAQSDARLDALKKYTKDQISLYIINNTNVRIFLPAPVKVEFEDDKEQRGTGIIRSYGDLFLIVGKKTRKFEEERDTKGGYKGRFTGSVELAKKENLLPDGKQGDLNLHVMGCLNIFNQAMWNTTYSPTTTKLCDATWKGSDTFSPTGASKSNAEQTASYSASVGAMSFSANSGTSASMDISQSSSFSLGGGLNFSDAALGLGLTGPTKVMDMSMDMSEFGVAAQLAGIGVKYEYKEKSLTEDIASHAVVSTAVPPLTYKKRMQATAIAVSAAVTTTLAGLIGYFSAVITSTTSSDDNGLKEMLRDYLPSIGRTWQIICWSLTGLLTVGGFIQLGMHGVRTGIRVFQNKAKAAQGNAAAGQVGQVAYDEYPLATFVADQSGYTQTVLTMTRAFEASLESLKSLASEENTKLKTEEIDIKNQHNKVVKELQDLIETQNKLKRARYDFVRRKEKVASAISDAKKEEAKLAQQILELAKRQEKIAKITTTATLFQ